MHSRTAMNSVLFTQFQENGFNCTWTGLRKMALYELVADCKSKKDYKSFLKRMQLFDPFPLQELDYEDVDRPLLKLLWTRIVPKLPANAVPNNKKCELLLKLFKKHNIETFTWPSSSGETVLDLLKICAANQDFDKMAKEALMMIALKCPVRERHDARHSVISYLTQYHVDVNALTNNQFWTLLQSVESILPYLCYIFSTPATNFFLDAILDAEKFNLIREMTILYFPGNLHSGSADLIRSFVTNGCFEVENDVLFRLRFERCWIVRPFFGIYFNDFLEVLDIFMDHGARLNPLPNSEEVPILHQVLKIHKELIEEGPKLLGFINKCVKRGVDPKLSSPLGECSERGDLLLAVCKWYHAEDRSSVIEFLCDCGAGESTFKNNGADVWSIILDVPQWPKKLVFSHFNETVLTLLKRGLRADYVNRSGDNLLFIYLTLHEDYFLECCKHGWLHSLDNEKFWDVLDALLDAGVQPYQVGGEENSPAGVILHCYWLDYEKLDDDMCVMCSQIYCYEEGRCPVELDELLAKAIKVKDRMLQS